MSKRHTVTATIPVLLAIVLLLAQASAGAVSRSKTVPADTTLTPQAYLPYVSKSMDVIYKSANLGGHEVFAECNPGAGTQCPCSAEDVRIESFDGYGQAARGESGILPRISSHKQTSVAFTSPASSESWKID